MSLLQNLEPHEKAGVDWLVSNGIKPIVKQEDPKAPANIDFEINGDLWEMKNVTNANSSVSNQIKRARIKWYKLGRKDNLRIIVTCEGSLDSFSEIIKNIDKRLRKNETAILLNENGEMKILKK